MKVNRQHRHQILQLTYSHMSQNLAENVVVIVNILSMRGKSHI